MMNFKALFAAITNPVDPHFVMRIWLGELFARTVSDLIDIMQ